MLCNVSSIILVIFLLILRYLISVLSNFSLQVIYSELSCMTYASFGGEGSHMYMPLKVLKLQPNRHAFLCELFSDNYMIDLTTRNRFCMGKGV